MSQGMLLIDGSNIGHASNSSRKLTVGDFETQAIYGFVRTLRAIIAAYPMFKPVILWDGSSWRKSINPDYKANRDRPAETRYEEIQQQARQSFNRQKPLIHKAVKVLGVTQMQALNLEADDLAGIMCRRLKKDGKRGIMISGDRDWIQLVDDKISWIDPINDRRISLSTIEEVLGVKNPRAWLEVKALMGDGADNLPGVGGIGEVGAREIINIYGSAASLINGAIDRSIDTSKLSKKIKDFAEDEARHIRFTQNMVMMDLNYSGIPAPEGMQITRGTVDPKSFRKICQKLMFKSILDDFDNWLEPFGAAAE